MLFHSALPTELYDRTGLQLLFGFVSVTRYFVEALAVAEQRCLPEQSGFTMHDSAVNYPMPVNSFNILVLAQRDISSVIEQSCNGWYAYILPTLMAGLTVRFMTGGIIHVAGRSQQCKKSLLVEVRARKGTGQLRFAIELVIYWAILIALFGLTCWFILRDT